MTNLKLNTDIINSYKERYGESNFLLVCMASVPLIISPDLLYNLWNNFKTYFKNDKLQTVSHIAVSDILLSVFCRPVGFEIFKIDEEIRILLRKELEKTLESSEIKQIATF